MKWQLVTTNKDGKLEGYGGEGQDNLVITAEMLGHKYTGLIEVCESLKREGMSQCPSFEGLYGGMYGGKETVRYESPAAYDRLSN